MNSTQLIFWRLAQFYQYFKKSKSQWRIHSPFMFEFYNEVFLKGNSQNGKKYDRVRTEWLKSSELIEIQDFGAGYNNDLKKTRKIPIAQVVKSSARKRKSGEIIRKIVQYLKPKKVLELGGNLGFSGLYIADALQTFDGKLTSIEGDHQLAQKAKLLHQSFGFSTEIKNQLFTDFLENIDQKYDLILLDGHHESVASKKYLNQCLNLLNPGGLFILDDIRWNPDMWKAWQEIIQDQRFTLTAETFQMGFIWPEKMQAKEHFILWSTNVW